MVTPPVGDTLLSGITRRASSRCSETKPPVVERALSIDELVSTHRDGTLTEVFGTGTAAVVAPVGEIVFDGGALSLATTPDGVANRLGAVIRAIQRGERADGHGWLERV